MQKHITTSVRGRTKTKAQNLYNKTANKVLKCEDCKKFCPNKSNKDAHLASRSRYINAVHMKQYCLACKKYFSSPYDLFATVTATGISVTFTNLINVSS